MIKNLILGGCFALLATSPLLAQATLLVDPVDPAYRDLQVLVDAGLISKLSLGQRPVSRAAFARALDEASKNLSTRTIAIGSLDGGSARRAELFSEIIGSLRERLDLPESTVAGRLPTRVAPILTLGADLTNTDQPTRLIPHDNGIGEIDATLNTLLVNREGRPLVSGSSALIESRHAIETEHVALELTPQLSLTAARDGSNRASVRLQELQLRLLFRNLAIDIGREYLLWGQGRDVGLLNSASSPPFNLVKLSSEQPFTFPWILRRLGPARFSIFYSDLGADQNYPHPYALGYRANILPSSIVELGVSVYTKSGGHGAPRATAAARLVDILPFLDASAYNNVIGARGSFQFSDHYAGFDGRLRIPAASTSLFWEVLLNDFDVRRLESVLWEDAGHVVGVDLPSLGESGRLRGSLEYHHTGLRYYEHHQFISGQTLHHLLTGDPLGPNAQGGYLNLDWYTSMQGRIGVQFALERRSNDLYRTLPEPNFGFARVAARPKEWQGRVVANARLLPAARQLGLLLQAGYERTRNFDFMSGDSRNGFLGRAAVEYRFQ